MVDYFGGIIEICSKCKRPFNKGSVNPWKLPTELPKSGSKIWVYLKGSYAQANYDDHKGFWSRDITLIGEPQLVIWPEYWMYIPELPNE